MAAVARSRSNWCVGMAREVVLADSSRMSTVVLERELREREFVVHSCTSGRVLSALVEAREPDLVVVELRLTDGPCLNRIQRLKQIRGERRVVVVTGHPSVATAVQAARLGIDAYLEKPASIDAVLAATLPRTAEMSSPEDAWDAYIGEQPIGLDRALWEYINRAVASSGSISAAGRLLGLDRRSLRRMLARYAPRLRSFVVDVSRPAVRRGGDRDVEAELPMRAVPAQPANPRTTR